MAESLSGQWVIASDVEKKHGEDVIRIESLNKQQCSVNSDHDRIQISMQNTINKLNLRCFWLGACLTLSIIVRIIPWYYFT
jgi:hypothetical protein